VSAELRAAPRPKVLVLALALTAWVAVTVWWVVTRRVGQPLNIDEAGYLSMALNDYLAWRRAGLGEWWDAVTWPGVQAPLAPAGASLLFIALGPDLDLAFAVVIASAVGVLVLTGALAWRLRDALGMWLAVLLLATTPDFLAYSRQFLFAMPATLAMAVALYALVRSNRMRSLPWSLVFGLAVGIMPATRTMMLAFVPGLVAAALVQTLAGPGRSRRLAHALAGAAVAVAVWAAWLIPSREFVLGYLTSFGYGAQSEAYANTGLTALGALVVALANALYLPHLLIFVAGWGAAAWFAFRRRGAREGRLQRVVESPLFPCAVVVVWGLGALASSRNAGAGFVLPLVPPAAVVAGWGFSALVAASRGWARGVIVGVVVAVPLLVLLGVGATAPGLATPRYVSVSGLGPLIVTEGRDLDPAYYLASRPRVANEPAFADSWAEVDNVLGESVLDDGTSRPDVAFGFRGYFVNVNTLQVEVLEEQGAAIPMVQIDPVTTEGFADYLEWLLTGAAATSCHLTTSAGETNEFPPFVDTTMLERAAVDAGFEPEAEIRAPDGRMIRLWERRDC